MAPNSGSVDPSKFPDEAFHLYSIRAFDNARPDLSLGREIGSSKQVVQPNDVLLSRIVPHIRRAWVVGEQRGYRQIASGEWIVFRSARTHPSYLRYLLVEDRFHAKFMKTVAGVGGSLMRARPSQVADIEVLLPPLSEQRLIAGRLEQADRLVRTRRYALELTDTFLPAAFLELFGDPVRNTKGWSVHELEELATVERGKFTPRPRNDPRYYGGRFAFIQTGDISSSEGRLRSWTQTLNEKGVKVSRRFPPGTVVIAIVGATIGMTAILEVDVYCPDSVVGIQVNPKAATKEYIEFLLRFWRPVFLAQAPETARANINLDTLRPLRIPVPPLPLQQKFAALVERVERLRAAHREALRQAEHLFASLLHRAFSG